MRSKPPRRSALKDSKRRSTVDSLVVMDDEEGFSGAVNRGPRAFADFLKTFAEAFGVDVRALAMPAAPAKGGVK
jgi:hypothetical protein